MTSVDDVEHPELQAMLSYWRARRRDGRLPGRRDIDPLDFPQQLPRVALVEVLEEPQGPNFRYRLAGTEIAARAGRDPTGKRFDQLYVGAYLDQALATYRAIVEGRRPHFSHRTYPLVEGREHLEYSRLILPLAADGKRVDMLWLIAADLKRVGQEASSPTFDPHNP
ncbi:MAG: PAS domain-containing protein [Marivibrio sp.]|uniref:PAS domain-containing protein n=1 Tax=Marivibrio sp. TaxID=2039719 RepID=UPI0032ED734C